MASGNPPDPRLHDLEGVRAVHRGSFCRRSRVLMRPCRRRGAVYSIPPWSTRRQFSQSPPSPPDSEGGGLAGYGLGASVGRRVEDGRTAVAPRDVHSIELENVEMIVAPPNDGHRAAGCRPGEGHLARDVDAKDFASGRKLGASPAGLEAVSGVRTPRGRFPLLPKPNYTIRPLRSRRRTSSWESSAKT